MRLASLLTRRGDSSSPFFRMDLGSLVVARDVGCRRVATFLWLAIWLKFVQDIRRTRPGCRKASALPWWKPCAGKIPNSREEERDATAALLQHVSASRLFPLPSSSEFSLRKVSTKATRSLSASRSRPPDGLEQIQPNCKPQER